MSNTIYNSKLIDLIPPNMQDEVEIKAYCAAFDAMFALVVATNSKLYVLANISGQESNITDLLAIQQHVDYYNQSLPLEIRRNLVKSSGFLHRIKGTPAAVEEVSRLVFGSAKVQEWFDYDGDPFHFRVLIDEFPDSEKQMDEVKRAIGSAKNARSILDSVNIIAPTAQSNLYIAGVIQISVYINVTQKQ